MDYMTNSMSIRLVMPYDSTHSGHHTTPHLRCRRQCPCPPRARVWYMRRRQQELTRSPGQLRTSDRDPRSQHEHPMLRAHFDVRPRFQKSRTAMGPIPPHEGGRGARGGYRSSADMSGIECDSRWIETVGGTAFVGCERVSERVGDGLWRDSDRKLVCPVVSGHFEMIRVFKSSVTGMGPVPPRRARNGSVP